MRMFSILFLAVLAGCGTENTTAKSTPAHAKSDRNTVQIEIKKGAKEWTLERTLEFAQSGYRLSAPITLPVGDPDEITLTHGGSRFARFPYDKKMKENSVATLSGKPLLLEFRDLPEPIKPEWVEREKITAAVASGRILIGGWRLRNNAKETITLQLPVSSWARVSQEERDWRMAGTDPCLYSSEFASREIKYEIQIEFGVSTVSLYPGEERVVPVTAFGETARALNEWKLPVSGPESYQRNNLFLGHVADFQRRGQPWPQGAVIVCVTDRTILSLPYNFPIGIERLKPVLKFSAEAKKLQIAFAGDGTVSSLQEFPVVENFLGFSR